MKWDRGKDDGRAKLCYRCAKRPSTHSVQVKLLDKDANGRAGTTVTRSRTFCEPCAAEAMDACYAFLNYTVFQRRSYFSALVAAADAPRG